MHLSKIIERGGLEHISNRDELVKDLSNEILQFKTTEDKNLRSGNFSSLVMKYIANLRTVREKIDLYSGPEVDIENIMVEPEMVPTKPSSKDKDIKVVINEPRTKFSILYDIFAKTGIKIEISLDPKADFKVPKNSTLISNCFQFVLGGGNLYYLLITFFEKLGKTHSIRTTSEFLSALALEIAFIDEMRQNGMSFTTYPKMLQLIYTILDRTLTTEHILLLKENKGEIALTSCWEANWSSIQSQRVLKPVGRTLSKDQVIVTMRSKTPTPKEERKLFGKIPKNRHKE